MNQPYIGSVNIGRIMQARISTAYDIATTRRLQRTGEWDLVEGIPQIQRLLKPIFLKVRLNLGSKRT